MRIAQVAPLHESVPPQLYGGTERVVHVLTEQLVAMGHDVTLVASGDSVTSAKLLATCPRSLRLDPNCRDSLAWHQLQLAAVARRRAEFDIIHFHIDYLHFCLSRALGLRQLTTLHGRLDLPELGPVYDEFSEMPLVSISDDQRKPLPQANWQATVQHGLDISRELFRERPEDYLAFVGRISREKRPDRAVEIARAAGLKLKVAAKIDAADREYYEREIAPLFSEPHVEFVGELEEEAKLRLMAGARALLMPIDWPEPFGLVVIESMACGTPVLAFRCGSMPEIIDEGVSGLLVNDMTEAVEATQRLIRLPREPVRATFERRFSGRRMAEDYVALYQKLVESRQRGRAA
ncbi:MAG TPA: glycosyltransferase family 4 protein [Polyangiaceae bacterium]|nr:glycosyltransferase family 4 protein [Polyangiaceae bacterium]